MKRVAEFASMSKTARTSSASIGIASLRAISSKRNFSKASSPPSLKSSALARLADAFADAPGDCPPEVGIFLGYPVRDVAGFIERPAEALPTRGTLWRVFAPAAESLRLMARIRRARDRALHLLALESDALRAVAMLRRLPSAAV